MHRTAPASALVAVFITLSSTAFAQLPPGAGSDGLSTRSAAPEAGERTELTAALVNKWKAFVQEAYQQDGDQCSAQNSSGGTAQLRATRTCCRVAAR